jgi:hypothetical protein
LISPSKAVSAAERRGIILACADDAQTWSTSQQLQPIPRGKVVNFSAGHTKLPIQHV